MSNEEIKLDLAYSEREYLSACRLLLFHSYEVIIRLALFTLLIAFGLWLLYFLSEDFPFWVSLAALILFEVAVLYGILVMLPRRHFRGDAKFRDRWELTFSEEGIQLKTEQMDSKLAWTLYTRVIEGRELFLLLYGKDLRMMTLVPKRAFQNRMQEDVFRELLTRHVTNQSSAQSASKGPQN